MSVGCYFASNLTLSWRLPLALACVPPLPLLFGLRYVPGELFVVYPQLRTQLTEIIRITPLSGLAWQA